MGSTASFASSPRNEVIEVSAANTARDGTGTIVSAFTAHASNSSRIDRIEIKATVATTAGMVRAFKKDGAGSWQLWREYPVDAVTPSASAASFSSIDDEIGEVLKAGMQIGFSTHNAETFKVHVSGGDF